jgi:hypothetical protein
MFISTDRHIFKKHKFILKNLCVINFDKSSDDISTRTQKDRLSFFQFLDRPVGSFFFYFHLNLLKKTFLFFGVVPIVHTWTSCSNQHLGVALPVFLFFWPVKEEEVEAPQWFQKDPSMLRLFFQVVVCPFACNFFYFH